MDDFFRESYLTTNKFSINQSIMILMHSLHPQLCMNDQYHHNIILNNFANCTSICVITCIDYFDRPKYSHIMNIFTISPKFNSFVNKLEHEENDEIFSSSVLHYFQTFSKLLYYTFLVPCHFTVDINKKVVIQTNKIQKVLCAMVHLIHLGTITFNSFLELTKDRLIIKEDPTKLYDIANQISLIFAIWGFSYLCWISKPNLTDLYLEAYKFSPTPPKLSKLNIFKIGMLSGMCTLFPLLAWISEILRVIQTEGFRKIYVGHNFWGLDKLAQFSNHIFTEYIVSFIVCICPWYHIKYQDIFITSISSFMCAIVHVLGKETYNFLKARKDLSVQQLTAYYSRLRSFFRVLNNVMGMQLLTFVICLLAYCSKNFTDLLESETVSERVMIAFYMGISIGILCWAADGMLQFQKVGDYIFEHRQRPGYRDNLDLVSFTTEMRMNPLGLRAHKFLITYGFIVTVLSTCLTYVVVLLQFASSSKLKQSLFMNETTTG